MQYDLLARLKADTAQCHTQLENALDLMRADWPREEYVSLLEAFYGYVAPWEDAAALAMPATLTPFFNARRKTSMLAADIATLTGDRERMHAIVLATAAQLPDMRGIGRVFGSMYVMEGSTLGGRFIAPHVASLFNLEKGHGNAYFDGYGARTGSMWNAFRETAANAVPAIEFDAAVDAATQTFEGLHAWLAHAQADAKASRLQSASGAPA